MYKLPCQYPLVICTDTAYNGNMKLFTGMRPTGEMHIGHYFGVIRPRVELQKTHQLFFMIADLHALTTLTDTATIERDTFRMLAILLASGFDQKKITFFRQSTNPAHSELALLFSMVTPLSLLELNPVYKEMLGENPRKRTLGLLSYPVLQAADILLYKPSGVPVGKDQTPHVEIMREIARRFNHQFGRVFPEPRTILAEGDRLLSLQDSSKKMSKSHSPLSYIGLLDSPEVIRRKIKSAITDSGREILYRPIEKPAISNLLLIYHLASGIPFSKLEQQFKDSSYAEFKLALADILVDILVPLQKQYQKLIDQKETLASLLEKEEGKARAAANTTLAEAKKKMGLPHNQIFL